MYLAQQNSQDFFVYWRASLEWIQRGNSPFGNYLEAAGSSYKGFVFKYPPWIVPLFLPLGFLSFPFSKILWSSGELFCIGYTVYWLLGQKVSRGVAILSLVSYWWVWLPHFQSGQITLILLATALFWEKNRESKFRSTLLVLVFSAKVFSLNSLFGGWKFLFRKSVVSRVILFVVALCALVIGVRGLSSQFTSFQELFQSWFQAAFSGGQDLPENVVRGTNNQGFTALILRVFKVPQSSSHFDILVFLGLTACLTPIWARVSRGLRFSEKWAGYLALGPLVHPLGWDHSFVLAFPVGALALGAAVKLKKNHWIALSLLALISVGCLSANIFPDSWVPVMQLCSLRSWGVCLSASVLVACGGLETRTEIGDGAQFSV